MIYLADVTMFVVLAAPQVTCSCCASHRKALELYDVLAEIVFSCGLSGRRPSETGTIYVWSSYLRLAEPDSRESHFGTGELKTMMNASFSYNTHDCRLNGSFGWQTALTATDGIARRKTDRRRTEWGEEGRGCDGDRGTLGREWTKYY